MNQGWLALICVVSLMFAAISLPYSESSHKRLDAILTLLFGAIGAASMVIIIIVCSCSPYGENAQLVETEVLETYTFDTSFPFSVKLNEVSGTSTTVVIDGYLSENEHCAVTKPYRKLKVFAPKENGSYTFEKVTATYRCTYWLFYDDKTRTEYHLYIPEKIIEKELTSR